MSRKEIEIWYQGWKDQPISEYVKQPLTDESKISLLLDFAIKAEKAIGFLMDDTEQSEILQRCRTAIDSLVEPLGLLDHYGEYVGIDNHE